MTIDILASRIGSKLAVPIGPPTPAFAVAREPTSVGLPCGNGYRIGDGTYYNDIEFGRRSFIELTDIVGPPALE